MNTTRVIYYIFVIFTILILLLLCVQRKELFRLGFTDDQLDDKKEILKNVNTVNIQLLCTETIVLTRSGDDKKDETVYDPRKALARNFSMKFDRRIRYIRICDNGACDPMTSYLVDLTQINQSLQKSAFRNDRVYVLEEEPGNNLKQALEEYTTNDVKTYKVKITTVLQTLAPVNAQLTLHDISVLIDKDDTDIFIYINKHTEVTKQFTLHTCWNEGSKSLDPEKPRCTDVEWSDDIINPHISASIPKLMIRFSPISDK
jgi:hypothetical protein